MNFPFCTLCIFTVGAIGGLVNALLTDNGFILPKREQHGGLSIMRPGVLGNCLISGVAAFISWGLYSSAASVPLQDAKTGLSGIFQLTPGILSAAMLVGISGARWLTNEVDKTLLRAAATEATKSETRSDLSEKVALATPAEAFRLCSEEGHPQGSSSILVPNPKPKTDGSDAT